MRARRPLVAALAAAVTTVGLRPSRPRRVAGGRGLRPSAARNDPGAHRRGPRADTWRSLDAMVDGGTGLPADNIGGDLDPATRSGVHVADQHRRLPVEHRRRPRHRPDQRRRGGTRRMAATLATLGRLERHEPSGMFYNWYDPATGEKLTDLARGRQHRPPVPVQRRQRLAGHRAADGRPGRAVAGRARPTRSAGRWTSASTTTRPRGPGGQIRGGFWDEPPAGCSVAGQLPRPGPGRLLHLPPLRRVQHRAADGVATSASRPARSRPSTTSARSAPSRTTTATGRGPETKPVGEWQEYRLGVPVFEGALPYRGMKIVPTWGGSMFEALMVPLFVPEESGARGSWGVNHPLYVRAQIEHGLDEAEYGYWGFSPSSNPAGGYREYGVDPIGMEPNGYTSDQERTTRRLGPTRAAAPAARPPPTEYGDGVVTPHASFLALRYAPEAALHEPANLRRDFDAYGPGGFYDAIDVRSGEVAKRYLSLDQGMVMAALGNALPTTTCAGTSPAATLRQQLRPLMRWRRSSPAWLTTRTTRTRTRREPRARTHAPTGRTGSASTARSRRRSRARRSTRRGGARVRRRAR